MRRVVDARDDELIFENGSRARVDAVIWCAGYNDNLGWIALPLIDGPGSLSNGCGRTPEEGFYVVGRKWLTCRASELILGIERDATKVVGFALAQVERNRVAARQSPSCSHH
jgi:putative flavoprotein involved in K+ transport